MVVWRESNIAETYAVKEMAFECYGNVVQMQPAALVGKRKYIHKIVSNYP